MRATKSSASARAWWISQSFCCGPTSFLARNEILREHYSQRFRHILVDEFQDTNRLQYRWLKLIAGRASFIFAVGDDDQSIYTFRGANVGNMADFERDFKVKHVVRLEQNYRSHGNILDAANALISNNRNRLGKNLWTDAGKGEPLRVFEGQSDNDEARWMVEEVQSLAREGTRLSHIAILYRSNAQSRVVEHALFSQGIPYRVYGGLRFFERAEIKHALAYLRLVAAPDDDNAFLRVVNFPTRGIGGRTLEQLQDAAKRDSVSLMKASEGTKAAAFKKLIDDLRAEVQGLPLPEMVEVTIARSGLIEHYKTEREGADRIENLEELVTAATAFTQEERETESGEAIDPLTAFLTHAALEAGEHQAGEGADALQMMTVHSAKGLEFDVVFLTGLEEGLFPHEQSVHGARGARRGAASRLCGHHPRAPSALPLARADPHAPWPDALQHPVALPGGDSAGAHEVAHPALLQAEGLPAGFLATDADGVSPQARHARGERLSDRPERGAPEVRRRGDRGPRRAGWRRAGAGELPEPRPEGARARHGEAAGRLG